MHFLPALPALPALLLGGLASALPALIVGLPQPAVAEDDVPPALLRAFNALATEADPLVARDPQAALARYADAAASGPLQGFGRIHLRMGQIHRDLGDKASAAWHFALCAEDERVDAFDREQICEGAHEALTVPLTITGVPDGGRVEVVAPAPFAGTHPSGARLPRGEVVLLVHALDRYPMRSVVPLDRPTTWEARLGAKRDALPADGAPGLSTRRVPAPVEEGLPRWPAYIAAGAGVALVGIGVGLGTDNAGALEDIRDRQRGGGCGADNCAGDLDAAQGRAVLADGLWIGGAVLAAGAVAWWLIFDGEPW